MFNFNQINSLLRREGFNFNRDFKSVQSWNLHLSETEPDSIQKFVQKPPKFFAPVAHPCNKRQRSCITQDALFPDQNSQNFRDCPLARMIPSRNQPSNLRYTLLPTVAGKLFSESDMFSTKASILSPQN